MFSPRTRGNLYLGVGKGKTIRVSDNLQEDVHGIENGSESDVLAIVFCDLAGSWGTHGQRGSGQASATLKQQTDTCALGIWMGRGGPGSRGP